MTELILGTVTGETEDGQVTITCPVPDNLEAWSKQNPTSVLIKFCDGRKASPEQIKKAHAMINDIAAYTGEYPDYLKNELKKKFILEKLDDLETDMFSFRDCSMERARLFITFLIDLMIQYEIPSSVPLYQHAEDIKAYVYMCLLNKTCCVCGRKGVDLHHALVPLGMGADRNTKPQLGWPVISLCRAHHNEAHAGERKFFKAYHLEPVKLDARIADVYKMPKATRKVAKEWESRIWWVNDSGDLQW